MSCNCIPRSALLPAYMHACSTPAGGSRLQQLLCSTPAAGVLNIERHAVRAFDPGSSANTDPVCCCASYLDCCAGAHGMCMMPPHPANMMSTPALVPMDPFLGMQSGAPNQAHRTMEYFRAPYILEGDTCYIHHPGSAVGAPNGHPPYTHGHDAQNRHMERTRKGWRPWFHSRHQNTNSNSSVQHNTPDATTAAGRAASSAAAAASSTPAAA
jgi:hypothetical protein